MTAEIDSKKALIKENQEKISAALSRKENVRIFLEGLRTIDGNSIVTKFDVQLWHALVEELHIMPDKTMVFHLRNGTVDSVKVEDIQ